MRHPEAVPAGDLEAWIAETRGLERDYLGELLRSRRRAWLACAGGMMVALAGIGAGLAGFLREVPPPLVLRVDNATGAVETVPVLRPHETSWGEVIDTYWLNLYVLNRESYDYDTIQLAYDTTALMSSEAVQRDYYRLFEGSQGRDKVLGNKVRWLVNVRSVVPGNPAAPGGKGVAVVRFTVQEVRPDGGTGPLRARIATVGYSYVPSPVMSTAARRLNPLGFQVTGYRVDDEIYSGARP